MLQEAIAYARHETYRRCHRLSSAPTSPYYRLSLDGYSMNRKKSCAPTRNSPCHCLLGGLTQGQGFSVQPVGCLTLILSSSEDPLPTTLSIGLHQRSFSKESPWSSSMARSRIIGIAVHRADALPAMLHVRLVESQSPSLLKPSVKSKVNFLVIISR